MEDLIQVCFKRAADGGHEGSPPAASPMTHVAVGTNAFMLGVGVGDARSGVGVGDCEIWSGCWRCKIGVRLEWVKE